MKSCFITPWYPLQTEFGGLYRNHLICLYNVHAIFSRLLIWSEESIEAHTYYKNCLWPEGVSWPWNKVIQACSRSLIEKIYNSCTGNNFIIENHWKLILRTKIVYDPKVCHDIDWHFQGHWQKKELDFSLGYNFVSFEAHT